jgi:2'-5' RNA ligase
MAAHVTLLFPFLPAARIDDGVLNLLREQFACVPATTGALELCFDRLARFPGVSYLALKEAETVAAKIRALAAAWPECPPYEGRFADVVPHLTVAYGDEHLLETVEAELVRALPLHAHVQAATLAVEDEAGRWGEHTSIALH